MSNMSLTLLTIVFESCSLYKYESYNYEQFKVGKRMLKVVYSFEILYPYLIYK